MQLGIIEQTINATKTLNRHMGAVPIIIILKKGRVRRKCKTRNILLVKRITCYTMEELNNKKGNNYSYFGTMRILGREI